MQSPPTLHRGRACNRCARFHRRGRRPVRAASAAVGVPLRAPSSPAPRPIGPPSPRPPRHRRRPHQHHRRQLDHAPVLDLADMDPLQYLIRVADAGSTRGSAAPARSAARARPERGWSRRRPPPRGHRRRRSGHRRLLPEPGIERCDRPAPRPRAVEAGAAHGRPRPSRDRCRHAARRRCRFEATAGRPCRRPAAAAGCEDRPPADRRLPGRRPRSRLRRHDRVDPAARAARMTPSRSVTSERSSRRVRMARRRPVYIQAPGHCGRSAQCRSWKRLRPPPAPLPGSRADHLVQADRLCPDPAQFRDQHGQCARRHRRPRVQQHDRTVAVLIDAAEYCRHQL